MTAEKKHVVSPELLDSLLANYRKPEDLIGEQGLLKQLTKLLVERALDAEMTEHLGHGKHQPVANADGNARNGKSKKTLKGDFGALPIDDHSRLGYTEVLADEREHTTTGFLERALAWFSDHGVTVERLMTDNGSAYRSRPFAEALRNHAIRHVFTRPYTPRTNGKAERFVQTALREWAYAYAYTHSTQRTQHLAHWQHFYNHHRKHSALGFNPPISRIPLNNLSNLNT